jgi:acetaldehyde dehydrogenase (acetylating)
MSTVTLEGTQELMKHRDVAVILATGGMGLVRAAYSAGKPAYGVGPGNAPAYIERTADIKKAVADIIMGKTFDNGVLCSSENSVVVDEAVAADVRREFQGQGGHFLSPSEMGALASVLVTPQRLPNPELVGRSASVIAERCGIQVAQGTRVLLAPLTGVGRDFPLSIEKLCPVLSFYVVSDWREGCERCKQILRYGGMGHTMSIHSKDDRIILEFGLKKPAFRIVVNSPTTLGSIGLTTGLDPAMMLGCGGWGGNITSDNITPRHLLNIKRLAYEIRTAAAALAPASPSGPSAPSLPSRIDPAALSQRIDSFLGSRGYRAEREAPVPSGEPSPASASASESGRPVIAAPDARASDALPGSGASAVTRRLDFVAEEDVRAALRAGATIELSERAIVTPAARDLGEQHRVFVPGSGRP